MKKIKKQQVVKMNISLEREFFELLQEKATKDYVRVATWVKQYLMKNLLEKNNSDDSNCLTNNGNRMGLQ
jgi:predicted DNA-binding ribbon-helix-helix protein